MKGKYGQQLADAVNFLGGDFTNPLKMMGEDNPENRQRNKDNPSGHVEFKDFGLKDYTLYYREPKEYWNEVGLLVPKDLNLDKHAPVHVFFMGGGFVSKAPKHP